MRILLINYEYPPVGGGAATATEEIARVLVGLGHGVAVLTGAFKGLPKFYQSDGLAIHRVPALRRRLDRPGIFEMASFLVSGLISANSIIREHRIEACIAFFSLPAGPIALFSRSNWGLPYVVSPRGGDVPGNELSLNLVHRILTPIRRAVLKNALAIVANSEGLRQMAEAADPFPVRIIPNGVDTTVFHPAEQPHEPGKRLRVVFVGRLRSQKNLSFLLREMTRLDRDTIELHLVGDGPLKDELFRLTEELRLNDIVSWHGWIPRSSLPAIYQSADCLVNPSLYEGMPNVVLEAMACGLPVIASRVPGNEELVLDGETGFLFDLKVAGSLADAIKCLNRDRELCARLGAKGRDRVVQNFSWRNVAEGYLNLYSTSSSRFASVDNSVRSS